MGLSFDSLRRIQEIIAKQSAFCISICQCFIGKKYHHIKRRKKTCHRRRKAKNKRSFWTPRTRGVRRVIRAISYRVLITYIHSCLSSRSVPQTLEPFKANLIIRYLVSDAAILASFFEALRPRTRAPMVPFYSQYERGVFL